MLYWLLRPLTGLALRLYYRRVEGTRVDAIPRHGPMLVVANHPNALVDALVVAWIMPRRVLMTGKATLFGNPLAAWFLRSVGVVPLRRAADETKGASVIDPTRNVESFLAITQALGEGRAVMIFPEGKSHDEPAMSRMRTGAARMALTARDAGVRGVKIVPVGLVFSRKEAFRSTVLAEVGDAIDVDAWKTADGSDVDSLTREIGQRLEGVTLNFASLDDAAQATRLAGIVARLMVSEVAPLSESGPPLPTAAAIARRLESYRRVLPRVDAPTRDRISAFVDEVIGFDETLRARGLLLEDATIETDASLGVVFVVRELTLLLLAGPVAAWGNVNHWLPFRIARALAMRSVTSASDPAMRTIVGGAVFGLLAYGVQGAIVWALLGPLAASLYLVSLPIAAEVNYTLRERLRRAIRRARTYLLFRRDPATRAEIVRTAASLRDEALALDAILATRSSEELGSDSLL